MKTPTIQDIARIAGVSTATVSRGIHEPHRLLPHTLQKVQEAMARQGYIYNALAGDLSRRRSSIFGLFIPTAGCAKLTVSAVAFQEEVHKHGFPSIVNNTFFDVTLERSQLRQCRERALAGLVFVSYLQRNESAIFDIAGLETPCVFLWDTLEGTPYNYVGIDNFGAAYDMTRYLLELGHRRVAFAGSMLNTVSRVRKLFNGYSKALEERGIPLREEYIVEYRPEVENGRLAMHAFLALPEPPTAVFFTGDMPAVGALTACREAGLRVPEDMSIAGFDDIDFAAHAYPPLTTVHVPAREIGVVAGRDLLERLNSKSAVPFQHTLPTPLVIRESCAPPKAV